MDFEAEFSRKLARIGTNYFLWVDFVKTRVDSQGSKFLSFEQLRLSDYFDADHKIFGALRSSAFKTTPNCGPR